MRLGLACVAGGGILLLGWRAAVHRWAAPAREVLGSELTLREGRLHRIGETSVPFTGVMVERYPSQSLKSRSMISRGVLHGISEGWHTNGQVQVREHFKNGVSHGLRTKWHENGVKMSEGTVVEGQFEGPFCRWHDNGVLAEEIRLEHGAPEGWSRSYYPSAFLKAQARFKGGEMTEQKFWKDGERYQTPDAEATD